MTDITDFQPKLEKALQMAGGTHTIADVGAFIREGKAQLWYNEDGMIVTEIEFYPRDRVLNFWLAAGEKDGVLDLLDDIYEWARSVGCTRATFTGRKGWARILADDGWESSSLVKYHKEL